VAHAEPRTRYHPCSLGNALWRNKDATELVIRELAPVVAPIIWLAARILEAETGATVPRGVVPSNRPGTREK
jgi:hypothetical protein